jgi:hypothetical protein
MKPVVLPDLDFCRAMGWVRRSARTGSRKLPAKVRRRRHRDYMRQWRAARGLRRLRRHPRLAALGSKSAAYRTAYSRWWRRNNL